jgi:pyridoxamine 5'-phosphate oxidase family protein
VNAFTATELEYLAGQPLGRLATVGPDGRPQVRPVGFFPDPVTGGVVIGGYAGSGMARSAKFRNATARPGIALVVDDVDAGGDTEGDTGGDTEGGWAPRGVEVRGDAETHPEGGAELGARLGAPFDFDPAWILLRPRRVLSWGIDCSPYELRARDVAPAGV